MSEVALPSEKRTGARDEGLVSLSQCGIKALRGPARSSQKGRGPMAKELEQISELESRKVAEASRETEWKQPSFLREMFLGNFRLDLIHPYPLPAEERPELTAFYNAIKEFLRDQVDPVEIDTTGEYPEQVVDGLRKLG